VITHKYRGDSKCLEPCLTEQEEEGTYKYIFGVLQGQIQFLCMEYIYC